MNNRCNGVGSHPGDGTTAGARSRVWLAALLAILVSAVVIVPQARAAIAGPAVSPEMNDFGFPLWYQDADGTRVVPWPWRSPGSVCSALRAVRRAR